MVAEIQTEVMALVAGRFITFSLEFLELVHNDYIKVSYAVAESSSSIRKTLYVMASKATIYHQRRHWRVSPSLDEVTSFLPDL